MIEIQDLGMTENTDDGVVLMMSGENMPPGCVVIFVKKEDYPALLEKLKEAGEEQVGEG